MSPTGEDQPTAAPEADSKKISARWRLGLWALAWLVATIAVVFPEFGLLMFGWMFPIGLYRPFTPADWEPPVPTKLLLAIGWAFYLVITVYGLRQKERTRYFIVYGILLILLVLNVVGCRLQLSEIRIST